MKELIEDMVLKVRVSKKFVFQSNPFLLNIFLDMLFFFYF